MNEINKKQKLIIFDCNLNNSMKQIIEIDWKMQEKNDQTSNQQFRNTVI